MKENKINSVIETLTNNLQSIVDVNTIIGKPINADNGDVIIPFSKITLGVLSGGGEYGKVNIFTKNENMPFSAGNGSLVSIKPCGFLVKEKKGYKILYSGSSVGEKIVDKTENVFEKILEKYEKN